MSPGDHSPVDGAEEQSNPTTGTSTLKPAAQDIPSSHGAVGGGNTVHTDLISVQPAPAAAPPAEASRCPTQRPVSCLRCGPTVPEQRLPPAGLGPQRGRRSKRSRSDGARGSQQPTTSPTDCCAQLLLACLSCRVSALLLALLEACSSCLHALCSSCCHACARCCSAVREAPVEELNCHAHCHSVLFESCCEPTECLEFCLECCGICHRS